MLRYLVLALVCVLSLAAVSQACPAVSVGGNVMVDPLAQASFAQPVYQQQAVFAAPQFAVAAPVYAAAAPVFLSAAPVCVGGVCNVGVVRQSAVVRQRAFVPRQRSRSLSIQRSVIR